MPDILDIVVVLKHIEHLGDILDIILVGELDVAVLGKHLNLSGEKLIALCDNGFCNGGNIVGLCVHDKSLAVGLKVVSACVKGLHHDGVLVKLLILVVDDDNALLIERPRNAVCCAHVSAVLIKVVANFACGTIAVIGHSLNDYGNAVRAVAFVNDLLVVVGIACTECFVDALNVIVWHVCSLCLGDDRSEA